MSKEEINKIIRTELQGNLSVLIDPKKKNSFSDARIHTWTDLVGDRIYEHLFNKDRNA